MSKQDNGWFLILENITRGYGNHKWYIVFISKCHSSNYVVEASLPTIFKLFIKNE